MTSSKTFTIAANRREEKEVTLTIECERLEGPPVKDSFKAFPSRVSPVALLRVATMTGSQDLFPLFHVFELAMDDAEYRRFMIFLEDKDNQVPIESLMEMFAYISEEAATFTPPSSGS